VYADPALKVSREDFWKPNKEWDINFDCDNPEKQGKKKDDPLKDF
jgi:hypothetical protein